MTSMLLALAVVSVQAGTGAFWWKVIRGEQARPLELLGMGLGLGTAAATLSGIAFFYVTPVQLAWAIPTLLTVGSLASKRVRRRIRTREAKQTNWPPALVALTFGVFSGLGFLLINLRNYPLSSEETITTYHPDMLFFEALTRAFASHGPSESIFMSGADLRYHWFTYAWAGQLSATVDAAPFVVLTRILPIVALVGTLLIAISWTQFLTRGRWAPVIAVALLVTGGYVGATYGTILNVDSPSQALSTLWLMALSVVVLRLSSRHRPNGYTQVLLVLAIATMAAATTGGKVSSVAVAGAGAGLVALVALIRREQWAARSWLAVGAMAIPALLVYLLVLAGSSEQGGLGIGSLLNKSSSVQGLNPSSFWWGVLAGTAVLSLAVSARWVGLLWLIKDPRTRWQPLTVFSIGLAVAGLVALLLFSGGFNDLWFALAASAPLTVTSAVGVSRAVQFTVPGRGWLPSRSALFAAIAGIGLTLFAVLIWTVGPAYSLPLRWTGPLVIVLGAVTIGVLLSRIQPRRATQATTGLALAILALVTVSSISRLLSVYSDSFAVQPESGFSPMEFRPFETFVPVIDSKTVSTWTPSMRNAAEWLANEAQPGALVATNLTYGPLVPALTGLQTWISAIQYQAPYGRPSSIDELLDREAISWAFTGSVGPYPASRFCGAGVDWVWVDPSRSSIRDWSPYAEAAYESDDVIILRMDEGQCQELLAP